MSLSKSSRHDCHYELKTDNKFFTCAGCKMSGFGQSFNCKLCGRKLHRECKYPETHITHDYFECSTLTFRENPLTRLNERSRKQEYSKLCDACGKHIRGYSYYCEAANLGLHPCCAKLEMKILVAKTVFNLVPRVSSNCNRCRGREISNGGRKVSGWSYVSDQQYSFHVYCMTEMLHEARLKHGDSALVKVDLKQLAKTKRNGGSKWTTFGRILKSFLSIIASILLGDPTILISNAVVDLLADG